MLEMDELPTKSAGRPFGMVSASQTPRTRFLSPTYRAVNVPAATQQTLPPLPAWVEQIRALGLDKPSHEHLVGIIDGCMELVGAGNFKMLDRIFATLVPIEQCYNRVRWAR